MTPSQHDIDNANYLASVAEKQAAEYRQVEELAAEALGDGYRPWMKLVLLASDYYRRPSAPVAVVYKVYSGDSKITENSVYIRRMEDGSVRHDTAYEPLFGELLTERNPTETIEVKGAMVHPPRYALCWSSLELYSPKSAEELAESRVKREAKKVEKMAGENPLFADAIRSGVWTPGR